MWSKVNICGPTQAHSAEVSLFSNVSRQLLHSTFCAYSVVVAFSSRARLLGECSTVHSPPALFFFFFLKWRLAHAHWFHSLDQDQSTVARQAETTVTECFLTSWVHRKFCVYNAYTVLTLRADFKHFVWAKQRVIPCCWENIVKCLDTVNVWPELRPLT